MTPDLFVAVPCYGGNLQSGFAESMLALKGLLHDKRVNHEFKFMSGESLIDRARNNLASDFLKSSATHLMFIDSDIDFDPEDVIKLLVLSETRQMDIVGGAYATKGLNFDEVVKLARLEPGMSGEDVMRAVTRVAVDAIHPKDGVYETYDECVEAKHIATGFMMVRRRVFEQLAYAHPELLYLNDHPGPSYGEPVFDFFEVRRGNLGWVKHAPHLGRKLSEDYGFCDLWRSAGGKVWVNLAIQLGHTGSMRYTGQVAREVTVSDRPNFDREWLDIVKDGDHPHAGLFIERYHWAAKFIRDCRVANAACGTNYGAAILQESGCKVVGYDIDPQAIAIAHRDGLVPAEVADVSTLELANCDALVTLETLEHLEKPFEWLANLAPSVKKLVSSVPCIPTMHFNPFHKHDFTVESFIQGLEGAGWKVRETWVQCNDDLLVYAERA